MRFGYLSKFCYLIIISILCHANSVWSCDCMYRYTHEFYQQAEAVFSGTVVQKEDHQGAVGVTFQVTQTFKGEHQEQFTLTTLPYLCGTIFDEGKEYIVFAIKVNDEFETGFCQGTQAITPEFIKQLTEAKAALDSDGMYREYYPDGKIQREITLKGGELAGPVKEFDTNGQLMPEPKIEKF